MVDGMGRKLQTAGHGSDTTMDYGTQRWAGPMVGIFDGMFDRVSKTRFINRNDVWGHTPGSYYHS